MKKVTFEDKTLFESGIDESFATDDPRIYHKKMSGETLFSGFLRLDDSQLTIKPERYGLKQLLVEIGGLGKSLFIILELTNMFLGRQLILRKIIGDLYLMKDDASGQSCHFESASLAKS